MQKVSLGDNLYECQSLIAGKIKIKITILSSVEFAYRVVKVNVLLFVNRLNRCVWHTIDWLTDWLTDWLADFKCCSTWMQNRKSGLGFLDHFV